MRNSMTHLFNPLTIRDVMFANRVFVSPMCQHSSTWTQNGPDQRPDDRWSLIRSTREFSCVPRRSHIDQFPEIRTSFAGRTE